MNIEERLEKLTERHEALTQTVELMAAENQQRNRRMGEIMEAIARLLHKLSFTNSALSVWKAKHRPHREAAPHPDHSA